MFPLLIMYSCLERASFVERIAQSENTNEELSMANSNMASKKLDRQA